MLPTPDTSHVPYNLVYEPAEDSFLILDTLSSPPETHFLTTRFTPPSPSPSPGPALLVAEVGSGSGVITAFLTTNSRHIFGPEATVLTVSTDVNGWACKATSETVGTALREDSQAGTKTGMSGTYLSSIQADLVSPVRGGVVDVLVFNPPYVPTAEIPQRIEDRDGASSTEGASLQPSSEAQSHSPSDQSRPPRPEDVDQEEESYLLSLTYAGGRDGMEITNRLIESIPEVLSPLGCAYVLLCRQNDPREVIARVEGWEEGMWTGRDGEMGVDGVVEGGDCGGREWVWRAERVGSSGKKAGWEKLVVVRIWRGEVGC